MAIRICVSLCDESIAQLEALRDILNLSPAIKRSTLIQQVIFQCYMDHQNPKPASIHGSSGCDDDCYHCADEPICDYSKIVDDALTSWMH